MPSSPRWNQEVEEDDMEDDFEQSDNSQLSSPMSQSNDEEMEEDFPYEHCEGNFSFLLSLIDLGRAINRPFSSSFT